MPKYKITNIKLRNGKTNTDARISFRLIHNYNTCISSDIRGFVEKRIYSDGIILNDLGHMSKFRDTFDFTLEIINNPEDNALDSYTKNLNTAKLWFQSLNDVEQGLINTLIKHSQITNG